MNVDEAIRQAVEEAVEEAVERAVRRVFPPVPEERETTWRERLWVVPAETRLGVQELQEALGVSESWIYRRTAKDADPIPHAKVGGKLVFKAGEVRAWWRDTEEVVAGYPMEPKITAGIDLNDPEMMRGLKKALEDLMGGTT